MKSLITLLKFLNDRGGDLFLPLFPLFHRLLGLLGRGHIDVGRRIGLQPLRWNEGLMDSSGLLLDGNLALLLEENEHSSSRFYKTNQLTR